MTKDKVLRPMSIFEFHLGMSMSEQQDYALPKVIHGVEILDSSTDRKMFKMTYSIFSHHQKALFLF